MKRDDKKEHADRLRALVESYGTNPAKWPVDDRGSREKLDAESADAPAWLTEQRRIDEVLDGMPDIAPSATLLRRVAEIPARHGESFGGWRSRWVRNVIGLTTAAAVLGLVVGMTSPEPSSTDDAITEWDDFSTLALGMDVSEEVAP